MSDIVDILRIHGPSWLTTDDCSCNSHRAASEIERLRHRAARELETAENFRKLWASEKERIEQLLKERDEMLNSIDIAAEGIVELRKPPALKICPPHLYIRFTTEDSLKGSVVLIGDEDEEGGCIDCEALKDTEFGHDEAVRIQERWSRYD